jgi:hypothetical protein
MVEVISRSGWILFKEDFTLDLMSSIDEPDTSNW